MAVIMRNVQNTEKNAAKLLKTVLVERIAELESGKMTLRVPVVRDRMRRVADSHFHLTPELFIQLSGLGIFRFPNETIHLKASGMLIVPRGMPHAEQTRTRNGPFHNLVVMYQNNAISVNVNMPTESRRPRPYISAHRVTDRGGRIADYLDDAVEAYHAGQARRRTELRGLMLAHLSALYTILKDHQPIKKREHHKVALCRRYVLTSLPNPGLSVKTLAEWIGCSADYLSHLFHTETGIHLTRFINEQRIAQAKELLKHSSYNISEIAYASGYADPGYFIRQFRKLTGRTPNQYRRASI